MKRNTRVVLVLSFVILAAVALWATLSWAAPGGFLAPPPQGVPQMVAYQGEVQVGGSPYTGHGYFKFAVVDAASATSYWSNDGSSGDGSEPAESVPLEVSDGLFTVLLGDTTLPGMTEPLVAEVFGEPEGHLRVWFSSAEGGPFEQLAPDTRIAAVPYALRAQEAANADTLDGLHASQLGADYRNVVVVAKSGGDYTSVQAAIDSVGDAAADNAYLVWVAPGVYNETVTMKPHVHLQGAGQEATLITSAASSDAWPPGGTLELASDTSLRDLTLGNNGTGYSSVGLHAMAGVTRTLVANVTAKVQGGGFDNYGIFLTGGGTSIRLQEVTALAENATRANTGLYCQNGAAAMVRGGHFTGQGGTDSYGLYFYGADATLEAEDVTALGQNGSRYNTGLNAYGGASAMLNGGSSTGRGGNVAYGIRNQDGTLEAESVAALGEDGTYNFGMRSASSADAVLHGGSFTAGGGTEATGIDNINSALKAMSVSALAEGGSDLNIGLRNEGDARATLSGGSFVGRGGAQAKGIYNFFNGATVETDGVTALGEGGSAINSGLYSETDGVARLNGGSFSGIGGGVSYGIYASGSGTTLLADSVRALGGGASIGCRGLHNLDGAETTLRGGSYTAQCSAGPRGVENSGSGTMLLAEGITALGEDGTNVSNVTVGLLNFNGATATLRGGSFTGRGGIANRGIYNNGSGATLGAEGVTALGEDGSSNYGLFNISDAVTRLSQSVLSGDTSSIYRDSGQVTISNSRLVGGAVDGTVTCILVTRDETVSTDGSTCP